MQALLESQKAIRSLIDRTVDASDDYYMRKLAYLPGGTQ